MFFRNLMGDVIAVLHEGGGEHRQIPERIVEVNAAGRERVPHERALVEHRPRVEKDLFALLDAGAEGVIGERTKIGLTPLNLAASNRRLCSLPAPLPCGSDRL